MRNRTPHLIAVTTGALSLAAWLVLAAVGAPSASAQAQRKYDTLARNPNFKPTPLDGGAPAPTPTRAPSPAPASAASPAAQSTATYSGVLKVGSSGDNVRKLEEKLRSMKYYVGALDSTFDEDTAQGVIAWQKTNGQARTGEVNGDLFNRIQSSSAPSSLVPNGGSKRVEIDLRRQVLFLYEGNALAEVLTVSTGTEVPYCENGSCGNAVTPTGDFKIYRKGTGWEYGPLGALYNPQYFTGGIAVHGSKSVPPEPASHGCVRITMSAAEWFPDRVPIGTPVYVR